MIISYLAGGSLVAIEVFATREVHATTAVVTEHPVETGVNVADHVRPELDRFSADVTITNHPIKVPSTNLNGATGRVSNLRLTFPTKGDLPIAIPGIGAALKGLGAFDGQGSADASVLQFDSPFDRVSSVWSELGSLKDAGTLLTLTTSLVEYQDMVLRGISAPRTGGEGKDVLNCTLDFTKIKFVATKRVDAPKDKTKAKKKNVGSKPATTATPEAKESTLHALVGKAKATFGL